MTYFSSIKDLTIFLRKQIIRQSCLKDEFVRNVLSRHGVDLDKTVNNSVLEALDKNDLCLFFELSTRSSSSNVTMTIDDEVAVYQSFRFHCICYGTDSTMLMSKLKGRLLTEQSLDLCQANGVYIESISNIESINDFINETMIFRSDFDINLTCAFKFPQIDETQYFTEISSLKVERI